MADYGASDTSTTSFGANQFPISEVYPPNGALTSAAGGALTALEGGPANTDTAGKRLSPASVYVRDGNDVTAGAQADAAVTDSTQTTKTRMAFLKGLVKIFADVWDSTNHLLHSNIKQVGGTAVSVNAGNRDAGTQRFIEAGNGTSAVTQVASAAADTSLLAANATKKGTLFFNDSTAILYLLYGTGAASTTNYSVQIPAKAYFEDPLHYTGGFHGIWSATNGFVYCTEIS